MKTLIVEASKLFNEITVPPSKSETHRAILFASIAKGTSLISNYLQSSDSKSMIAACQNLGAKIKVFNNQLEIEGIAGDVCGAKDVIQANNSGIILRFFTSIASKSLKPIVITGDESIRTKREMQPLMDALNELGVDAYSLNANSYAPIFLKGPISKYRCCLKDGSDSQYVSALLMAASMIEEPVEIKVKNPGENLG